MTNGHWEYRLAHPDNPRHYWKRSTDLGEVLRSRFDAGTIYREEGRIERRRVTEWEQMRDCDIEFGDDHDHDDVECARMLAGMNGAADDGLAEAFNREAEEQMLGRPLLPNEY